MTRFLLHVKTFFREIAISSEEKCLSRPIRRQGGKAHYSTLAMALTTASMFLLFNAATQMRPVSTA